MEYSYRCTPCRTTFTKDKMVKDIDSIEHCADCGQVAERFFNPGRPTVMCKNLALEKPEWNPALGKVINSKAHLNRELGEMKAKGHEMIELGNESPEKMHDTFDKDRRDKANKRWAKASEELGLPS